jgi:hypothetical protein
MHEGVTVDDANDINKVATSFYRELFGPSASSNINMTNLQMNQLNNEDRVCSLPHLASMRLKRWCLN